MVLGVLLKKVIIIHHGVYSNPPDYVNSLICFPRRTIHEFPGSIRGMYGLSDTRNATHGSGYYVIYLSFI